MDVIPKIESVIFYQGNIELGCKTMVSGEFKDSVELLMARLSSIYSEMCNTITILRDDSLQEEEYTIEILDNVIIKASSNKGAFYACQTLFQLLHKNNTLPCLFITDKPNYEYRGIMLDVARHFFSVEKIKQIIDLMASLKMNYFHYHLTDDQGWRAEIKKYPALTSYGAIRAGTNLNACGNACSLSSDKREYGRGLYYTREQMLDIVDYAKKKYIEVIPEIDMPGHLVSAIACYPHLSCRGKKVNVSSSWGIKHNIACCGNEDFYNFAYDVIDELCDIFPSKYFHIGGDEVPKSRWKVCPKCQKMIKKLNLREENYLQGYFNKRIAQHLKNKGKILIGWNEILDSIDILEENTLVQWWTRRKNDTQELKWQSKGGKFILSISDYVYMDHPYAIKPLSKTYSFSESCLNIDKNCVLGVEAPQWTEYIRDVDKLDLNTTARIIAMSEVGWTIEKNKDYTDFETRLENMREYLESFKNKIAHRKIYRGKTLNTFIKKLLGGNKVWRVNPYFEVDAQKKLNL